MLWAGEEGQGRHPRGNVAMNGRGVVVMYGLSQAWEI